MKIELRKVSTNARLSEETNCFSADIYIDGVKAGYASNRGQGGNTDYGSLDNPIAKGLIKDAEKFCAALPADTSGGITIPMDLEYYIDILVDAAMNDKEVKRFEAKTAKDCLKSICYGIKGKHYRMHSWKGMTIEQVMKHTQGRGALIKAIETIKAKLQPNEKILNTNLGDLLK